LYDCNYLVHFKYDDFKVNDCLNLKSFEFINEESQTEFTNPNQNDMLMIYNILKTKMNFIGFHEIFRLIKPLGSGNFSNVEIKY